MKYVYSDDKAYYNVWGEKNRHHHCQGGDAKYLLVPTTIGRKAPCRSARDTFGDLGRIVITTNKKLELKIGTSPESK
jgi:hypothetical protein